MGYSTDFLGELRFANEPSIDQVVYLQKHLFGKCSEELGADAEFSYIDLELTDDFRGIRWDGSEKTYGMDEAVNFITGKMREMWPDFTLTGMLTAQGEEFDDRWELRMVDGKAVKVDIFVDKSDVVQCSECGAVGKVLDWKLDF